MSTLRVAADVGGTFTDIACIGPDGALHTGKIPSTPADFAQAVVAGIQAVIGANATTLGTPAEVLHASTVATNAILEGKGARTALVTTAGFRDVLELRRIRVPRLYEPLYEKPAPLVPRSRRHEVNERLDARGAVVRPLDATQLHALAEILAEVRIEAVAIAFLHSWADPVHERRAAEILRAALPGVFISVSSEVLPEMREYERTSTAVVNAYVGPVVSAYLESLRSRLRAAGVAAPLRMMVSSGGVVDVQHVIQRPATVIESGPAAGVVGAARIAASAGYDNLITFDMGGTTAKASLIEQGQISTTDEYEVGGGISLSSRLAKGGGYALKLPVVDVSEVGAGGGSLVQVDSGGGLRVGPESAGAVPGPACYARGGTQATVTDASVVLGYLNPVALAGGSVPLDAARAHAAIGAVAARLQIPPLAAAHGVFRLVNATMMRAVKAVSTFRGRDPRGFALFAFGGNGGIHAAALAAELGMTRVIVPPAAGVFSAVGLLCADREAIRSVAYLRPLGAEELAGALFRCAQLEQVARTELGDGDQIVVRWRADLRYAGQGFELPVDLQPAEGDAALAVAAVRAAFEAEYARTYGHAPDGAAVEFVAVRVMVSIPGDSSGKMLRPVARVAAPESLRQVWFGDELGLRDTPVISRAGIGAGTRPGPLVIEEYEGTTLVPPGAQARLDASGSIIIDLPAGVAA